MSKGSGIKNWLIIHAKDGIVSLEGSKYKRNADDGPVCYLYLTRKEALWLAQELTVVVVKLDNPEAADAD